MEPLWNWCKSEKKDGRNVTAVTNESIKRQQKDARTIMVQDTSEPSPGHGWAQGGSHKTLLTRPHTKTKHRFSEKSDYETLQSRPLRQGDSSLYNYNPEYTTEMQLEKEPQVGK